MELRQTDERRCETVKPRRFKIDKLEERIAPSADAAVDAILAAASEFHSSGQQLGLLRAYHNVNS